MAGASQILVHILAKSLHCPVDKFVPGNYNVSHLPSFLTTARLHKAPLLAKLYLDLSLSFPKAFAYAVSRALSFVRQPKLTPAQGNGRLLPPRSWSSLPRELSFSPQML